MRSIRIDWSSQGRGEPFKKALRQGHFCDIWTYGWGSLSVVIKKGFPKPSTLGRIP